MDTYRAQVLVTGRAPSGALAVTTEQGQLISWRATKDRPGTTSPVQWISLKGLAAAF